MICEKINKSFKFYKFTVIVNPNLQFSPYYISSKNIICSYKREHCCRLVYILYKNFDMIFLTNNTLNIAII